MSLTVLLVRHGETDWNVQRRWQGQHDVALNDRGRAQARAVADHIGSQDLGSVRLITSDLMRAADTAACIGRVLGHTVERDQRLREIHVGTWSGSTHTEIAETYPEGVRPWEREEDATFGGAESVVDVRARVRSVLTDLEGSDVQTVVAVTHGGVIRIGTAALLGTSRLLGLRGSANASLTTWVHDTVAGWQLAAYNSTDHLADLQPEVSVTTREHAA